MSLHYMKAAWEIKTVKGTQKVVLLRLADHADGNGNCFPSDRHLMEYCGINKRQLVLHLNGLETLGYVEIQRNPPAQNTFRLTFGTMQKPAGLTMQESAGSPCRNPQGNPALLSKTTMQKPAGSYKEEPVIREPPREPPIEPKEKPKEKKAAPDYDFRFAEFWKSYPRKVAKENAVKAWNKLKPKTDLVDVILADISDRLKCDEWSLERSQYIPHPASYLNTKRWTDETKTTAIAAPNKKNDYQGGANYDILDPNNRRSWE